MSEDMKILPCPFCGNAEIKYHDDKTGYYHCETCGLRGPHAYNNELALDRWNILPRNSKWRHSRPTNYNSRMIRWVEL